MKFNELDKKIRAYELANDPRVLPDVFIVVRLDGRSFTSLTKEKHSFEAPYDPRFRDMMVETTKHLMKVGFNIVYGYTQSDEISLLFDLSDSTFDRKERKIISILSGEASAKFSLLLNDMAVFDSRICPLPNSRLVVDYFRWRNEDANRNALNAHCYWALRKEGVSPTKANQQLDRKSIAEKNEILYQRGIQFNDLPNWQKRGVGIYWKPFETQGENPLTGKLETAIRKRLIVDYELPMKDRYSDFVASFIPDSQ